MIIFNPSEMIPASLGRFFVVTLDEVTPEKLKHIIADLLGQPERVQMMGIEARKLAADFDWSNTAVKFEELLTSVINKERAE